MADIVTKQPGAAPMLDQLALDKLANVDNYGMIQSRAVLEAATCGCASNKYVITDRQRQTPILAVGQSESAPLVAGKGDTMDTPIFVIEEESGCLSRFCCSPHHKFLAKVFHAGAPYRPAPVCGCERAPQVHADKTKPPVLTMERDGCCNKIYGCFVCTDCCAQEMVLHAGNVDGTAGEIPKTQAISTSKVPCGGGGCHPQIDVTPTGQPAPTAYVGGPMCFGGCLDLCADTFFTFSRGKDRKGDIGTLRKLRPEGCGECCRAVCSDADTYHIDLASGLNPLEKATMLSNAVLLDYAFFSNDNHFCYVQQEGNTTTVYINLCLCYLYGCLCPIQLCIPIPNKK